MSEAAGGALRLENVTLRPGGSLTPLFRPLSLTVRQGEIVAAMGPSGVGKSSLLSFICGTLPREFTVGGRIWVSGREVSRLPPERRRIGILFQDDLLFPHLSVGDNLAFALPSEINSRAERRRRIDAALRDAGLAGYAERDPATLSGGQRTRVAVMRTLLAQPRALLLDEPFSKLDADTRAAFRQFVFEHARAYRLPTLLVTHDPADAQATGGAVIELIGPEAVI